MKEIKIGFLQQHNVADPAVNIQRLAKGIADLATRGAQLIVLQELHNSLYFCQVEDVNNFDFAEPIPGPSTGFYVNWPSNTEWLSSLRCLKSVPRDSITIRL